MSVHRKSLWRNLAKVAENGEGERTSMSLRSAALALQVAERLKEEGFSGYAAPTKETKIKSRLSNAEYIAFLPDNALVVSDKSNQCIRIFDTDGSHRKCLVSDVRCLGVTANRSGMVAFVDNHRGSDKFIKVVSSDDQREFAKWGEDMVWKPRAIAMSNKGQLVISDTYKQKHQVGVYTLDGRNLSKFGKQGEGDYELNNPMHLTVDPFDRIIVSDFSNHCIKVFDDHGTFLMKMGSHGSEDGCLLGPRGICSDSKGNLLVCDSGNKRISVFSSDGKFRQHILTREDGLNYPRAMALDRTSGMLAVSQHYSQDGDATFKKIRVYQIEKL